MQRKTCCHEVPSLDHPFISHHWSKVIVEADHICYPPIRFHFLVAVSVATTTGLMNEKPAPLKVPNMSKIKMPTTDKPKQVTQKPVEQPQEEGLLPKVENLTNEDKAVLSTVVVSLPKPSLNLALPVALIV